MYDESQCTFIQFAFPYMI